VKPQQVTEQILSAFDEEEPPVTEADTAEEEVSLLPEAEVVETPGVPKTDLPEEDDGEDAGDDDDEVGETEEPEEPEGEADEPAYASEDPEIQAFLAKYQGDLDKALRGAAEMYRLVGRRDQERDVLAAQVEELAAELERVNALSRVSYLDENQQAWVESAIESGDPRAAVKAAVDAGQFDLARGVCEMWAQEAPYDAARLAAQVDQVEQRHNQRMFQQQQQPMPVDHSALVDALADQFPDMRNYGDRMTQTLTALGENHPLVREARGNDLDTAARAILSIYEIARASTATVSKAREQVRREQRQAADEARNGAVVSTAEATPTASETPRQRMVTPGLSFSELDEAFEQASK
jgi:hypothetical protein